MIDARQNVLKPDLAVSLPSRRSSRQPLPEHLTREVYVQMPEADHTIAGRSENRISISERRFAAVGRQLINRASGERFPHGSIYFCLMAFVEESIEKRRR